MKRILLIACCVLLSACGTAPSAPLSTPGPSDQTQDNPALPTQPLPKLTATQFSNSPTSSPQSQIIAEHPSRTNSQLPTPNLQFPNSPTLDPSNWKDWPIIPTIDPSIRAIYEYGQSLGNDPHSFSIFGDCQARPDEFFAVFDEDAGSVASLSSELREAVANFHGSFNRESPTAQDGTTPGALLWTQWHQGNFTCTFDETPVECELRIHRPSFVIIQIGTHFESRNTEYLRKIITQLIDAGVVPILATKADNRELDDRINRDMALLASEYDLPLWNFWAALSDLPERGLYTRADRPLQGAIYLNEEAALRHRMTGLEALNVVWRAATGK